MAFVLVLTICTVSIVGGGLAMLWPGRLDVTIGEPETTYDLRSGVHAVQVRLLPTGNDNGMVDVVVEVDGRRVTTVESLYNYDLFSDQPAGEWTYRWIDGDILPDLVLTTSSEPAQSVYVGTVDGQAHIIP